MPVTGIMAVRPKRSQGIQNWGQFAGYLILGASMVMVKKSVEKYNWFQYNGGKEYGKSE